KNVIGEGTNNRLNEMNAWRYVTCGPKRTGPSCRFRYYLRASDESATADLLRGVSGLWESSANGWEVLQPVWYSTTLPFLRNGVAWEELLPHLWSASQALTVPR